MFYLNNKIPMIDICTNGYYTEKIITSIENIMDACKGLKLGISMSLDGDKNTHDAIRKLKGSYDNVVETYKRIENIKNKYGDLSVNLAVTISSFNQNKIKETYNLLTNELRVENIRGLLIRGNPRNRDSITK